VPPGELTFHSATGIAEMLKAYAHKPWIQSFVPKYTSTEIDVMMYGRLVVWSCT